MLFEWTCIEPQPGEVDGDFLAEVQAYVVEGLVLVPLAPACPVVVQNLTVVELTGGGARTRIFKRTVMKRIGGLYEY